MMRVLHVCAEVYPFLKTGGLADVAAGLPPALNRLGCATRLLVPGFPALLYGLSDRQLVAEVPPRFGAQAIRIYSGALADVPAYVIDAPGLYDRAGNPYADSDNQPYADNYLRFALLGWIAARLTEGLDPSWTPLLVHGHDWHAGLAPAYIRAAARESASAHRAATVLTIHNLAYQGIFDASVFGELELPADFFDMYGLEFYGQVSFLKAGLFYSDKLSTVSPTYASEIQGAEQGCGLDGLLSGRRGDLAGILNGVDYRVWDPAADAAIAAAYDRDWLEGKRACKRALQAETGLQVQDEKPLFGVVSRLTEQKGLNLVLAGLPDIVAQGGQLVLLGSGDGAMEAAFRQAAATSPQSVSVQLGYDESRAHQIVAGSDVILVPSLFEPCGLTQLYGLRYGALPLVRRVGGLSDSVVDSSPENLANGTATGIVFDDFTSAAFNTAAARAFTLFTMKTQWMQVQRQAMAQRFSWEEAAKRYLHLYESAIDAAGG